MAYEDYCAACTYLGENADYERKYYCDKKGERVPANDPKCYRFIEAYSRSDSGRKNMYDNSSQSSGCYLTTAMCNILGYQDDNYYLQTLRTFRDETLKKDVKYIPLLLTYDIVGPQIASNLLTDPNRKIIAQSLFNGYITKTIDAINEEKVQEAINFYIAMTYSLAERYNINMNALYINPESINLKTINTKPLGHGRSKTLTKLEKLN